MYEKMTDAEWNRLASFLREPEENPISARNLKRPAFPMKGFRPKIKRNQSPRQRIAESQSPNLTRAMYVPENDRNQTPTLPDDAVTTKEVGPGDRFNNNYRAGKSTDSVGGSKTVGHSGRRRTTRRTGTTRSSGTNSKTLDELLKEYL